MRQIAIRRRVRGIVTSREPLHAIPNDRGLDVGMDLITRLTPNSSGSEPYHGEDERPGHGLIVCLALLLLSPRVVILPLGGSSLRLEDFLLAGMLVLVIRRWRSIRARGYASTGVIYVALVSGISVLLNSAMRSIDPFAGALYGARVLEYWIVFPLVWMALVSYGASFESSLVRLLKAVTIVQVGVAAAQVAGVLTFSFSKFSLERGAGLTAGPYELGAICAALACVWFARGELQYALIATLGVVLSSSRISLVAVLFGVLWLLLARTRGGRESAPMKVKPQVMIVALFVGAAGLALGSTTASGALKPIGDRLGSTSISSTWHYAGDYASAVSPPASSAEYSQIAYQSITNGVDFELLGAGGDTSNLVRFFRWRILLNSTDSVTEWAIGHGPSFAGPSVDGAIFRVVIELGLVGLVAWGVMAKRLFVGRTKWIQAVGVTYLIGSMFIDVLFAMRPMLLLWILVALNLAQIHRSTVSQETL
jgi:hypothetical protein